jgi:hypothetical protein
VEHRLPEVSEQTRKALIHGILPISTETVTQGWKSRAHVQEASEDEDFGKKIHRKGKNTSTSRGKRSRVSSAQASDSDAFKFSRTGKQVNYNEKKVDYGLGESEDEEEIVRPKANVDYQGADADEIEGVFGWARDEMRLDDPVDLPYENIVSLGLSIELLSGLSD